MKALRLTILLAAAIVATAAPAFAGDDPPAWLKQAAAVPAPTYEIRDVPAVVLVNDQTVTVSEDGSTVTTGRYAVRVLVREGRSKAVYGIPYIPDASKIRDFKAWLVRDAGASKTYGKNDFVDMTSSPDEVYDEGRARIVSAADDADAGSVFGVEFTIEEQHPLFAQDEFRFQDRLPALSSRLTLALPSGWTAQSVTFNHDKIEPTVSGSTYAWELHGLQPLSAEASGPPVTNMAPRVAYTYSGPEGAKGGLTFATWPEVSRWATKLMAPQAAPNDAIAAKARELTAGATTEIERVRAVGRFVQSVRYVAITTNLAKGGGYRPHAAADVFAKSYGDCKDKANLMISMLRTVGVTAYPVVIYSGDPTYVRREWAAPTQFNHCIVAVKLSDAAGAASTIERVPLGTLLIFDPTDTETPVGDLPDHEQGSFALLVAGDDGDLVRMPEMAPETNGFERETEVALTVDGAVSGHIRERSSGQSAVGERRLLSSLARPDYDRRITRWITSGVAAAKVTKIAPVDDRAANRFSLDVDFAADGYAQIMQGRLFVFKPALVARLERLTLNEPSRTQPVVLDGESFREVAQIALPDGFDVDETPDPVKLETPFGVYATSYEVKGSKLVYTRALTLKRATLPVADYPAVRAFFEKIRGAEQAPVVLVKK